MSTTALIPPVTDPNNIALSTPSDHFLFSAMLCATLVPAAIVAPFAEPVIMFVAVSLNDETTFSLTGFYYVLMGPVKTEAPAKIAAEDRDGV